jgi:hypothetical protein
LDIEGFDKDPLKAARVEEDGEEEMEYIEQHYSQGEEEDEFDPDNFEVVKVSVSYTLTVKHAADDQTKSTP